MRTRQALLLTVLLCIALLFSCEGGGKGNGTDTAAPDSGSLPIGTETKAEETLPDPPAPETEQKDGTVSVTFASDDPKAGIVTGKTVQTLRAGSEPSERVRATARIGYVFLGWSDGVKEAERKNETFRDDARITAMFGYDLLDLPALMLTTGTGRDVASKTEYIDGTLQIVNAGGRPELEKTAILIRGRGNNTWSYEKKSYKFKLEKKENLLGCADGKGKTWVLLANMCDQSLLRNRIALSMGNDLSHIAFEPHTCPVEVWMNGEYLGCYLLAEEIKVGKHRVALDEETETGTDIGFLVELSAYAEGEKTFQIESKKYQIRSDLSQDADLAAKQTEYLRSYMERAMEAIRGGNEKEIRALIDVDSFVDTYLLEEVTKNLDMGWDSFYLTKDKGGKLALGPGWDFDLSFGNADESCELYTDIYAGVSLIPHLANPWLYRIMRLEWFRVLVQKRWNEMEDTFRAYPTRVLAEGESGYRSYCRNFERWKIFGKRMNRETERITSLKTYDEHVRYLSGWISDRIDWLDACISSDYFRRGIYILPGGSRAEEADAIARNLQRDGTDLTASVRDLTGSGAPFAGEEEPNLLDGRTDTKYCCSTGGELTLRFSTESPTVLRGAVLVTANDTALFPDRNPVRWTLFGSDVEHGNWTVIDDRSDVGAYLPPADFAQAGFTFDNGQAFTYYKWVITGGGDIFQLSEIRLYS